MAEGAGARAALVALAALVAAVGVQVPGHAAGVLQVPGDFASLQAAVDASQPGDVIQVAAGTFRQSVWVARGHDGITIQGAGRDATLLEGDGELGVAVYVQSNGVTIRDMAARNFTGNGFYFSDVDGFGMERLAAGNTGEYGLYAIRSQHGHVTDSVAWGHRDAGVYVGESLHCYCLVENVEAFNNVNGYSGTASNYITIRNNDFHHNRMGLSLSVLPSEPGVQQKATIVGNRIHDNNNPVPAGKVEGVISELVGVGVLISGGWNNAVQGNQVWGNDMFGIAVHWLNTPPMSNRITDNTLWSNGVDLWWDEWGSNNCWEGNHFASSDPAALPACHSTTPIAGFNNVGVPNASKDAFLVVTVALQDGQPGTPYVLPEPLGAAVGPVPPLPLP